ncbi:hypothetical protein KEM56_000420 [Ascosphaera pollenicola]|nr:hypothetical protein KEM56_000420 [Ascosphaera pollenicola]
MAPQYELRSGGAAVRDKKQSMHELKLRRLNELNVRLKEDLDRPRVKVAEASMSYVFPCRPPPSSSTANPGVSLINYCNATRDYMVPSIWGQVDKRDDPYAPQQTSGCCTVM